MSLSEKILELSNVYSLAILDTKFKYIDLVKILTKKNEKIIYHFYCDTLLLKKEIVNFHRLQFNNEIKFHNFQSGEVHFQSLNYSAVVISLYLDVFTRSHAYYVFY